MLGVCAALCAAPAFASADVGRFRTVIVIDASSSMQRTDPRGLRKVAAELFVDLARKGDQIAVTGFDENARQSTKEFIVVDGPESRQRLKDAIRAIGNDGAWTDFTAGLGEARRLVKSRHDAIPELVVFLTDGKCEPDPKGAFADEGATKAERTQACLDQVMNEIVPAMRGARIYPIGLSRGAPEDFLEELGRRTGGKGAVALDPAELPRLFADVYARLLGSRLQEGTADGEATFEVYDGAKTLDVVVVGRTTKTGKLLDPAGRPVPIDNREPDRVYFVGATEYRFYKVANPAPGTWKLEVAGGGTRRFASLQHFDLRIGLVEPPEYAEMGKPMKLTARLATPEGTVPPADFLDRHRMYALMTQDGDELRVEMKRAGDGWEVEHALAAAGKVAVGLALEPAADGVLQREDAALAEVLMIPPVSLVAKAAAVSIKQEASGVATISMEGSEVGMELGLAVKGEAEGIEITPREATLAPDGIRTIELELKVDRDAPSGERTVELTLEPKRPIGFSDKAVTVPLVVEVVPLSFWERHNRKVIIGGGALALLVIVLGFVLPASFPKRSILYYKDVRDPDLERKSSYPLGAKAKKGFFRAAEIRVGPTGPVKKGGAVTLVAGGGNKVVARPASSSAKVVRAPGEDEEVFADEDRPSIPLKEGTFRMASGVRYEIEGSGLVFWYE